MKIASIPFALLLAGCSTTAGVPATGLPAQGTTAKYQQSETALNVSNFDGKKIITVTYNDITDSDATILYSSTNRTVFQGATLLGWSYSTDNGATFQYGGKVPPPPGWSIIWGDPAITHGHVKQRYVFIANLAVPDDAYPDVGIFTAPGVGGMGFFIKGACIARSEDGGVTFKNYQCVHKNSARYDGGSMAAGTDGAIYAAFRDTDADVIDIWRSPNENGTFELMPNAFPGWGILSHPRLRVDASTNALYAAALNGNSVVLVNRFHKGAWGTAIGASLPMEHDPKFELSDRRLRSAVQFSFDVGAESVHGNDGVRFLYTIFDEKKQRRALRGSFCPRDLAKPCQDVPEWGTSAMKGDQLNPNVRAFPGLFGLEPAWKVSYLTRQDDPDGNQVAIYKGNLAVLPNGIRILIPSKLVGNQVVCGDNRGYWGDYDDMQLRGFSKDGVAEFIRGFSDSRQGCTLPLSNFISHHLHVSTAVVK